MGKQVLIILLALMVVIFLVMAGLNEKQIKGVDQVNEAHLRYQARHIANSYVQKAIGDIRIGEAEDNVTINNVNGLQNHSVNVRVIEDEDEEDMWQIVSTSVIAPPGEKEIVEQTIARFRFTAGYEEILPPTSGGSEFSPDGSTLPDNQALAIRLNNSPEGIAFFRYAPSSQHASYQIGPPYNIHHNPTLNQPTYGNLLDTDELSS